MAIERKNVRDVLVWPHDHHATPFAIDAAHGEDVIAVFQVGAEHFFVVAKSVTSLPGQKKGRHGRDGEFVMTLLENRSDIDHRVDVFARRGVFPHRRLPCLGKKVAQGRDAGVGRGGILRTGKSEDAPAAVRLDRMAKVNRLGVRETDDRRGMKTHADRQTFGQLL